MLDDHARFAIAAKATKQATTTAAWECMDEAIRTHGAPRQVISDNGLSFTGRRHRREVLFERNLKALGIQPLTSQPRHPQTCGKLERFHQTLKAWLADRPPAQTIEDLQALLDEFRWHTGVERPHQALQQATPAEIYNATEKTGPLPAGDGTVRPRALRVNPHGAISYRKRKIQVGAQLRGQTVHTVEDNGIVRVYHGHELIRELLLGPKGTYHGNGKKSTGRPPKPRSSSVTDVPLTRGHPSPRAAQRTTDRRVTIHPSPEGPDSAVADTQAPKSWLPRRPSGPCAPATASSLDQNAQPASPATSSSSPP